MTQDFIAREFTASRHILTSPTIAARTIPYIGDGEFDWDGLLVEQETMSGGERLLVLIAHDLWEGQRVVGVSDLARRLDRSHFERVVTALSISRGEEQFESPRLVREAA
jgi:hypothetical protein